MNGTIKWIDRDRGFGFIVPDDDIDRIGAPDRDDDDKDGIFFHVRNVLGGSALFVTLNEGDRVQFELGTDQRGVCALDVQRWVGANLGPAHYFTQAALLVERGLALLNVHRRPEDTRFENMRHAKAWQHLRYLPEVLRTEAALIDDAPHDDTTTDDEVETTDDDKGPGLHRRLAARLLGFGEVTK